MKPATTAPISNAMRPCVAKPWAVRRLDGGSASRSCNAKVSPRGCGHDRASRRPRPETLPPAPSQTTSSSLRWPWPASLGGDRR